MEVIGEASDGDEAIACVGRLQPALVAMDMNMKKNKWHHGGPFD
jgi:chemotaxis response regulator CheB